MAAAGDVNGDGFSDIVVQNDFGPGNADISAYFGAPYVLNEVFDTEIPAIVPGQSFGSSLAVAGDVNGDGFDDAIVGDALYDGGAGSDAGALFVYHGSASGLPTVHDWSYDSSQAGAKLGSAVAGAGDVNGDGYDDVIAGACEFANPETVEGIAYVFHGSAAGLSATPDWSVESDQNFGDMGSWVAAAGDVNGDGYGDVLVGAPGIAGVGRITAYHGSAGGLSATASWTLNGTQGVENLGFLKEFASAGDVNGDGYSDVVIASPRFDTPANDAGKVEVYLGSASGLSTTPSWHIESADARSAAGFRRLFGRRRQRGRLQRRGC